MAVHQVVLVAHLFVELVFGSVVGVLLGSVVPLLRPVLGPVQLLFIFLLLCAVQFL